MLLTDLVLLVRGSGADGSVGGRSTSRQQEG
jgi:hypothetical protein